MGGYFEADGLKDATVVGAIVSGEGRLVGVDDGYLEG